MNPDEVLDEMIKISQELGLYDLTPKEKFSYDLGDIEYLHKEAYSENSLGPQTKKWAIKRKEFIEKWGPKDDANT